MFYMTTIINTPPSQYQESSDSGVGMIIGIITLVILVGLFFVYILPIIQTKMVAQNDEKNNIDLTITIPKDEPLIDAVATP